MKRFIQAFVKVLVTYVLLELFCGLFKLIFKGIKKIWYRTGHAVKCSEEEVKNL